MAVDHDLVLVTGLLLLALALPSLLAALVDERPPVVAGGLLLCGSGLSAWSLLTDDRPFHPADLPDAIFSVIGRYLL